MVQSELDSIREADSQLYDVFISEVNATLNPSGIAGVGASALDPFYAGVLDQVRSDLGRDVDFANVDDRIAIGDVLIAAIRKKRSSFLYRNYHQESGVLVKEIPETNQHSPIRRWLILGAKWGSARLVEAIFVIGCAALWTVFGAEDVVSQTLATSVLEGFSEGARFADIYYLGFHYLLISAIATSLLFSILRGNKIVLAWSNPGIYVLHSCLMFWVIDRVPFFGPDGFGFVDLMWISVIVLNTISGHRIYGRS